MAKSLNELYTEPAPKMSPFDLPQEFPLTKSVSTTTEIFSHSNKQLSTQSTQHLNNNGCSTDNIKSNQGSDLNINMCGLKAAKSMLGTTNLGGSNINRSNSGNSNRRAKSKDELFSEFCERAGHRPKPKDIYFIEDIADDNQNIFVVDRYDKSRRNSCALSNIQNSNLCHSNTSLNKSYPKSLFDLDQCDRTFLNNRINNHYFEQNNSRDRYLYNSRTLPRDFLKRNVEFFDDAPPLMERRISASGVYASSTINKDSYGFGDDYYKKSYDAIASGNFRQRDAYSGDDTISVHWPNAIPASPSSFSTKSQFRIRSGNSNQQQHSQQNQRESLHNKHNLQIQNPYNQLQEPMSPNDSDDFDTFDLDKMENERRKSHASLFEMGIDEYENGTPV